MRRLQKQVYGLAAQPLSQGLRLKTPSLLLLAFLRTHRSQLYTFWPDIRFG